MRDKHLHIISFDVPYPPNYGGVIDVYYKILSLYGKGVKIHLHCIEYPGRDQASELKAICEEVHYYPRKTGLISALSLKPYIVASRRSKEMLDRLLQDDYPILFEGLHSCNYIDDPRLKGRVKVYRESNIEHRYYYNLFRVCKNLFNRLYYLVDSLKLYFYQRKLRHADTMLCVSKEDTEYLKTKFPENKVFYLPSFHTNNSFESLTGKGDFALYHGNIEVPENSHAAAFLINEVFNDIDIPLVIAGMNPPERIRKMINGKSNITVVANPDDEEMSRLVREAHVNVLVTFQATGLKLKLLNVLYQGRFCLVNSKMLNGTGLEELCVIGNDPLSLKARLNELFDRSFTAEDIHSREGILGELYSNTHNADKLISLIWE